MSSSRFTFLLKGATVYDGSGGAPFAADIGIHGNTISALGISLKGGADTVIDVSGLCVSPGFIDTHGHSEFTMLSAPSAEGKVLQGITTEINGNCGLSAAPLLGKAALQREGDLNEYGITVRWSSFEEYFRLLEDAKPALNFATLAGHGNIRASVMGYAARSPDAKEMKEMKLLLEKCLEAGAIGLSTGLIYPPGVYSTTAELAELAEAGRSFAGDGFIYTTHMRSEGHGLLDAVKETMEVGRLSGARVHISHIKTAGRENWSKAERCIAMLKEARAEGVRVTCDRYPYTAGSTDLDSVLPSWAFEGGSTSELERLRNSEERERMRTEMNVDREYWETVFISEVGSARNSWMEGKNVPEVADALGMNLLDGVFHVLAEESLRVGAVFHSMSEDNLIKFLSLSFCMVGSDSSARSLSGPTHRGKPHPRGFGSFPRFLKHFAGSREEAIYKITGLPARTFGINKRGIIKEGYYADLVVFHAEELTDRATFEEPFLAPAGIRHVIVNGRLAASAGAMTGNRTGRVLKAEGGM